MTDRSMGKHTQHSDHPAQPHDKAHPHGKEQMATWSEHPTPMAKGASGPAEGYAAAAPRQHAAPGEHPHSGHRHAVPAPSSAAPQPTETATSSLRPGIASIVQAGAFGAVLGGMGAGVVELARVKQGEITSNEAVRNVVKSSAQGAATMAVASLAGQVVRSHPVVGVIVLAAAGIGALTVLSNASANKAAVAVAPPVTKTAKKPSRPAGDAAPAT